MSTSQQKPAKQQKTLEVGIKPGHVADVVILDGLRIEHGKPVSVSADHARDLVSRSKCLQIVKG
jgi:hypothetical protein